MELEKKTYTCPQCGIVFQAIPGAGSETDNENCLCGVACTSEWMAANAPAQPEPVPSDKILLAQVRDLIVEWDSKKGHDRCWYYPDLFKKIAKLTGVELTQEPELPSRKEFEEGCCRYQNEQFKKEAEAQQEAKQFMRDVLENPEFKKDRDDHFSYFKFPPNDMIVK